MYMISYGISYAYVLYHYIVYDIVGYQESRWWRHATAPSQRRRLRLVTWHCQWPGPGCRAVRVTSQPKSRSRCQPVFHSDNLNFRVPASLSPINSVDMTRILISTSLTRDSLSLRLDSHTGPGGTNHEPGAAAASES